MIEGRKKIFIFLGVVFFVLLLILLLVLFLRPSRKSFDDVPPTATSTVDDTVLPIGEEKIFIPPIDTPPPPPVTTEERERLYVKQLSRTFVERFETYSNQNDNRNIEDASELATDTMAAYVASKSQEAGSAYQGVTTKVISMDVTSFAGGAASVKIGAQVESQTESARNTTYKNGRVELLKVEGVWKVNGLFWDPT